MRSGKRVFEGVDRIGHAVFQRVLIEHVGATEGELRRALLDANPFGADGVEYWLQFSTELLRGQSAGGRKRGAA